LAADVSDCPNTDHTINLITHSPAIKNILQASVVPNQQFLIRTQ